MQVLRRQRRESLLSKVFGRPYDKEIMFSLIHSIFFQKTLGKAEQK
jgi:hypothetical protein